MDQSITLTPYNLIAPTREDARAFAKTFMYKPPQGELYRKRGQLFALLSITNLDPGLDPTQLAKQVFDHLQQEYFDETGAVLEALEDSAQRALRHGQQLLGSIPMQLNLVTVALWGKGFYYFRTPNTYLGQVQNDELLDLDQHQLGSDALQDGDKLVLSTPLVAARVLKPCLQELAQPLSLEEKLPGLREKIYRLEEDQPAAAIIIDLAVAEVPSEEEIIEIEVAENHTRKSHRLLPAFSIPKFRFLFSAFGHLLSALRFPSFNSKPEIYLKPRFPQSKRGRLVVALVLVGLLGASAFATHKINQRQEKRQQAQEIIQSSTKQIKKARELATLNPAQAQRELKEAENQLGAVLGINDEINQQAQQLQNKLSDATAEIYQTQTVEARAVESADELNSQSLTVDTAEGIARRSGEALLTRASEWQTPIAVEEYFDNLYVLDPAANQIHKYIGIPAAPSNGVNYSSRRDYFKHTVNLSGADDLAIDGSIYVLYGDGRVLKFTGGEREEFSLGDFHPPLDGAKLITTRADSDRLYIIQDNTVLIFNKNGGYQHRLRVSNLNAISDLLLSDDRSTLYLLSGSDWYQLTL